MFLDTSLITDLTVFLVEFYNYFYVILNKNKIKQKIQQCNI